MMVRYFAPTLTRLGVLMAHPAAFLVLACYVGAWLVLNPKSFDWQSVATVATWLMTLFIQRAEHRDTQAIHAKLDELLRVEGRARSELTSSIMRSLRSSRSIGQRNDVALALAGDGAKSVLEVLETLNTIACLMD
jgi:low affinity Fe/Cu permease